MSVKFYVCPVCGNLITKLNDSRVPVMCCGKKMEELIPNTVDASGEKHVPVVSVKDGMVHVEVGAVEHPMQDEHYIQWIYVETERGGRYKALKPGEAPKMDFCVGDDKPVAVYEYCNLHGLWKTEL